MKTIKWLLALSIPVLVVSCKKESSLSQSQKQTSLQEATTTTGSGAPSGAHYNLNIVGVDNPKKFNYDEEVVNYTQGNGHVIFVPLTGTCKIWLKEGSYDVLDANGTDGNASFQLPASDPENDGTTTYSVYLRALGKKGGTATMTSCIDEIGDADGDGVANETYCSIDQDIYVSLSAHANDNKFTNVSKELLYVYADTDGDGVVERIPLFSSTLWEYYWNYTNSGLRLAQLRFYDISTNVGSTW